jgi:hypothetical protein
MEFKFSSISEATQEELEFSIKRGLDWFYDKISIPFTKLGTSTPKTCAQQMLFLADITSKNKEEEVLFEKIFERIQDEYLKSNEFFQ